MEVIRVTFNPKTGKTTMPERVVLPGVDATPDELRRRQEKATQDLVSAIVKAAMNGDLDIWKAS